MRELKFRIWTEKKKEMSSGMPLLMLAGWISGRYPNLDDEVYLQYTGLHDKNGKEIYEGDIVKGSCAVPGFEEIVEFGEFENDGYYEDYERGVGFFFRSVKTKKISGSIDPSPLDAYVVLGNIYENADLLGKIISPIDTNK